MAKERVHRALLGAVVMAMFLLQAWFVINGRLEGNRTGTASVVSPGATTADRLRTPPTPYADVTIEEIEVTQATQDEANMVSLVAGRRTAVRVKVSQHGSGKALADASRLYILDEAKELTPPGGIPPSNVEAFAPATPPDRDEENDTLNFEVIDPFMIPTTGSGKLTFRVVVPWQPAGSATITETTEATLTVLPPWQPKIHAIRLGLGLRTGPGPACSHEDPPAAESVAPGMGDAMVRAIYPVADDDTDVYRPYPIEAMCLPNDNDLVDGWLEYNGILWVLSAAKYLLSGSAPDTHVYGWLHDNPLDPPDTYGFASQPGRVAYGNTLGQYFQRTFAHEIGHNLGLTHAAGEPLVETGWDVGNRLEGNPAANGITGRVKSAAGGPGGLMDVMQGSLLSSRTWINPKTYRHVLGEPQPYAILAEHSPSPHPPFGTVLVRGAFDPDNGPGARVQPLVRVPWETHASPERADGTFELVLVLENESSIRHRFDAFTADGPAGDDGSLGFFEVVVAIPPERDVMSLVILDATTDEPIPIVQGPRYSRNSPLVDITLPAEGATISEPIEVTWDGRDLDAEPSEPAAGLRYHLLYSPDGGTTFGAVAVDIEGGPTGGSAWFEPAVAPPSEPGQGVLMVIVTDGFRVGLDRVNGLTVTSGE